MRSLIYDLLHEWPLAMISFWMFPLFFAYKFIDLGRWGVWGRGIPFTSSKRRWGMLGGKMAGLILVGSGWAIIAAFIYWLGFAIYKKFAGLG